MAGKLSIPRAEYTSMWERLINIPPLLDVNMHRELIQDCA